MSSYNIHRKKNCYSKQELLFSVKYSSQYCFVIKIFPYLSDHVFIDTRPIVQIKQNSDPLTCQLHNGRHKSPSDYQHELNLQIEPQLSWIHMMPERLLRIQNFAIPTIKLIKAGLEI